MALADASITSPFLEKFGRSSRDTGLESDRNSRPTAAQRLHMLNSSHVRQKMETSPKLRALLEPAPEKPKFIVQLLALLGADTKRSDIIVEIYLAVLSRTPTEDELQIAETHFEETWADGGPRDLFWALINSPEFCYRH